MSGTTISGGSFTNPSGHSLSGPVALTASGTAYITNNGGIIGTGTYGVGVELVSGKVVNTGLIEAWSYGRNGIGTGEGVFIGGSASIDNSGTILAGAMGVLGSRTIASTLTNSGDIAVGGSGGDAVYMPDGVVFNSGTITAVGTVTSVAGLANGSNGVVLGTTGVLANSGTIDATGFAAEMTGQSGALFNLKGLIGGTLSRAGVLVSGANEYVYNSGRILGARQVSAGLGYGSGLEVYSQSGGQVVINNVAGGVISGAYAGVLQRSSGYAQASAITVINDGIIAATNTTLVTNVSGLINRGGIGVALYGSSTVLGGNKFVSNAVGGLIAGYQWGVALGSGYAHATLVNQGEIISSGTSAGEVVAGGVLLLGGTIINSGLIESVGDHGMGILELGNGDLVVNTGTIMGDWGISGGFDDTLVNSGYIQNVRLGAGSSRLVVEAGARFGGSVTASYAPDFGTIIGYGVLELAAGTSSLDMGGSFIGFGTVSFDPEANWTLAGTESELALGETITGFHAGDAIVIENFSAGSESYVAGEGLVLGTTGGSIVLELQGTFSTDDFVVTAAGGQTTIALDPAPCFCAGTHIRTPGGEAPVEILRIGDEVVTAFAGVQRVKWIGRRAYEGRFIAGNHLALPVCIKADALADGVPARDLWVSPDHAICEAGVFIHAWRLVNGVSIVQADAVEQVSYIHVELDGHHVIFAENCPTESFFDEGARARFQNGADYVAPDGVAAPVRMCLPLLQGGFHLQNIRARLAARAGIVPHEAAPGLLRGNLDEPGPVRLHGWAQDVSAPEEPVLLEALVDGRPVGLVLANEFRTDLRAAGLGSGCHAFSLALPEGGDTIELRRVGDGATFACKERVAA